MLSRSLIFLLSALFSVGLFAQENAKPKQSGTGTVPPKKVYVLKSHQVERMNRLVQQQEEAQKKGISPERHFQMHQHKQQEQQRVQRGQSNQPISYAPKP